MGFWPILKQGKLLQLWVCAALRQEDVYVGTPTWTQRHELKALPDPVKVSSASSPVVVVDSLLCKGSVLTARRDTMQKNKYR